MSETNGHGMEPTFQAKVKAMLEANGYVVIKAKSYRAAQQRQHQAKLALEWSERATQIARRWGEQQADENRRLRDRLTFVYGVAKERGATAEDLRGCEQCRAHDDGSDRG